MPPDKHMTPEEVAAATVGVDEMEAHVVMVHALAAPLAGEGKLIVASFGENPQTGAKLPAKVEHIGIGDVIGMIAVIQTCSASITRTIRPSRARHGNGLPVYFRAISSMIARSGSGCLSTTRPRIIASSYGSRKPTIESATRGSRRALRALIVRSPVATRMRSRPTHTGSTCGDPLFRRVAR